MTKDELDRLADEEFEVATARGGSLARVNHANRANTAKKFNPARVIKHTDINGDVAQAIRGVKHFKRLDPAKA
ncbi:MAG TPA: hypothetical protein VG960_11075 [Caulobacteraceae bacterium]|nr:hypothetical protein [Caulobacteraceae bacterium]